MTKIKLTFNDDHIKLIKNLRFSRIEPSFIITPNRNDVSITDIGNGRYDIESEISLNEETTIPLSLPITVRALHDQYDSLYGVDTYNLWGGDFIYEDIAYIIGCADQAFPDSLEDIDGPKYPKDVMERLDSLAMFIIDNLSNIEEIVHQYCTEGIKPNVTYWCRDNEHIWKIDEK